MTVPAEPGGRVRIAIASPEILAHIRQQFTDKGWDVRIDGLPTVEVLVTPGSGPAPGANALAGALNGLAGPQARHRHPATARYRLALVPRGPASGRRAEENGPPRAGGGSLSPREAEVMDAISRGLPNADIAALLEVRHKTVKNHVNRIFAKLGARSRVEAVLIWQRTRGSEGRQQP
ncbi:helix-turn-helix transcriptional regulator [Actinoplanes cyaneus]|uniref:helix-turn-helix transcriptional regulator n=1 Tax=Actinoplanes cyaneus TaxID=52696 RepID=UPI0019432F2A|nr:helix-turn-helix transcriptional regulator [Actinoplanes cyaneus]